MGCIFAFEPRGRSVTWTVRAQRSGQFELKVRSSTGVAQTQPVTIVGPPPDAGKLTAVRLSGPPLRV